MRAMRLLLISLLCAISVIAFTKRTRFIASIAGLARTIRSTNRSHYVTPDEFRALTPDEQAMYVASLSNDELRELEHSLTRWDVEQSAPDARLVPVANVIPNECLKCHKPIDDHSWSGKVAICPEKVKA